MQPHQKHILWPQKHTESQVPSCILRAKKEPGSQPLQAGKIKIKTKDYLACPLMTGLITDLEDVFRPSLPPAFTPTAHSVSSYQQLPPKDKTKPFSAHQFAVRVQGAQQLPEPWHWSAAKPDFPEQGRDCAETRGRGKKTPNKPQTKNHHTTKTKQTNPRNPLNPFPYHWKNTKAENLIKLQQARVRILHCNAAPI